MIRTLYYYYLKKQSIKCTLIIYCNIKNGEFDRYFEKYALLKTLQIADSIKFPRSMYYWFYIYNCLLFFLFCKYSCSKLVGTIVKRGPKVSELFFEYNFIVLKFKTKIQYNNFSLFNTDIQSVQNIKQGKINFKWMQLKIYTYNI